MEAKPVTAPRYVGRCINKVATLCIEWAPVPLSEQNGAGFGYIVEYRKADQEDEQWEREEIMNPDITQFVVLVGEINEYTEYDVRVRTKNNKGVGPITEASSQRIFSAMGSKLRTYVTTL